MDLTNIRIEDRDDRLFSGKDASGSTVKFRASAKDAADLFSILFGDLALNFSGVEIDPADIVR